MSNNIRHLCSTSALAGTLAWSLFAGAAAAQTTPQAGAPKPGAADATSIAEVVVTAEKRPERLLDAPVPVSVLSATTLVATNETRLQDYYSQIPSLDLTTDTRGASVLSIRGISQGAYSSPTVAVTIDGVPLGASTFAAFSWAAADLDPNELANIEVLRGPQGTLYGDASLGGLIQYVTIDPTTAGFSGRVEVGGSAVSHGDTIGNSESGAVNIPLSDTLAVRVSGFNRLDPGYITDVLTGQKGVNSTETAGGRASLLWTPLPTLSLKVSALYEDSDTHGSSYADVQPGLGDLQQSYIRNSGGYNRIIEAYSADLDAKLGDVDVKSITGYSQYSSAGSYDVSNLLGGLTNLEFGVSGAPFFEHNKTDKFSEELRFSGTLWKSFDWLVGGFYTLENTHLHGGYGADNPLTGAQVGVGLVQDIPLRYQEAAIFVDGTYHVTERFSVQAGLRESEIDQTYLPESQVGPYDPILEGVPSPNLIPEAKSSADAFTYLVTPQYKFTPDAMVYARFSSGYRPGGSNVGLVAAENLPLSYRPDQTENYEVGLKVDALQKRLSVDASVFYIDWRNIQVTEFSPSTGLSYVANAGAARSDGVELSLQARPIHGLTLSAEGAWTDAQLTKAFPIDTGLVGGSGSPLPYNSRFSGSVSVLDNFPIADAVDGFVGGSINYVGTREGEFTGASVRQTLPSYTKVNLRLGVKYSTWTANLYVDNLTDTRGILQGGIGTINVHAFEFIRPRTVGVSLAKTF